VGVPAFYWLFVMQHNKSTVLRICIQRGKKMTSKEVRLCIDSYFAYFPVQFTILLMFVSWKFGSKPALLLCI